MNPHWQRQMVRELVTYDKKQFYSSLLRFFILYHTVCFSWVILFSVWFKQQHSEKSQTMWVMHLAWMGIMMWIKWGFSPNSVYPKHIIWVRAFWSVETELFDLQKQKCSWSDQRSLLFSTLPPWVISNTSSQKLLSMGYSKDHPSLHVSQLLRISGSGISSSRDCA